MSDQVKEVLFTIAFITTILIAILLLGGCSYLGSGPDNKSETTYWKSLPDGTVTVDRTVKSETSNVGKYYDYKIAKATVVKEITVKAINQVAKDTECRDCTSGERAYAKASSVLAATLIMDNISKGLQSDNKESRPREWKDTVSDVAPAFLNSTLIGYSVGKAFDTIGALGTRGDIITNGGDVHLEDSLNTTIAHQTGSPYGTLTLQPHDTPPVIVPPSYPPVTTP